MIGMRFVHHSRILYDRRPQGAVVCGGTLTLSADADADILSAAVRLFTRDGLVTFPMQRTGERVTAVFPIPDAPQLAHYDFALDTVNGVFYCGAPSGQGELRQSDSGARYPLTVYRDGFATPGAFCQGVAYQIFPDRFYCSDRDAFFARAAARNASGRRARVHERWEEAPAYLPLDGERAYAPDDYFGGDLEGVRQKLPYLCSLGVSYIYLNPVFEAYSNHRYNTADYLRIDPLLGTDEDFVRLCADAEQYGIRLILDGVFSHTGDDSRYFDRLGRYGGGACQSPDSPYFPWYTFTAYPDGYECWWNFPTLPNVREMTPSYLDFVCGENGVLQTWLARGAGGWRLDVADELPDDFIRAVRSRVKQENPDAVLLGEVWDDCSDKMGPEGRRAYVDGDLLDGAMNYPLRRAILSFLAGNGDAFSFNEQLQRQREHYPKPFYDAQLNLISSHDEVRAITFLSGAPERDAVTREQQAAFSPDAAAAARGRALFLCATALQMLLPGVPCLYYGDEAGLTGMNDPFNRTPYPWGHEDTALLESVRALTRLRRDSEALRRGYLRMGAVDADVFCVVRYTDTDVVIGLVNRRNAARRALVQPLLLYEGPDAETPIPLSGAYRSLAGDTLAVDQTMSVMLPPYTAVIYRKEGAHATPSVS